MVLGPGIFTTKDIIFLWESLPHKIHQLLPEASPDVPMEITQISTGYDINNPFLNMQKWISTGKPASVPAQTPCRWKRDVTQTLHLPDDVAW